MTLVGEAAGGYETLELFRQTQPDVLVLDLSMPDLDGIAVIKHLKPQFPHVRILMLTIYEDEALLREAFKAGAAGYILKHAAEAELISAIHVLLRGDFYVDPAMLRRLLHDETAPAAAPARPTEALTRRETEVLTLLVQGYTNRQISEALHISIRTAESHRANVAGKLGVHSRVDLVRYARAHGLIT